MKSDEGTQEQLNMEMKCMRLDLFVYFAKLVHRVWLLAVLHFSGYVNEEGENLKGLNINIPY